MSSTPYSGTAAELLAPFARDVLLATGRAVRVRSVAGADVHALRRFYDELGDTSTYFRWFGISPFISTGELTAATVQDPRRHVALLAESDGEVIGVGEYHARAGEEDAEVSFAVADRHHHEGVATVLLEDLAVLARAIGFRRLVARTLPGNAPMLAVFKTAGLVHRSWHEDGTVKVELDLTGDDLFQDRADLRDWSATVCSLQPLVQPEHVVVIGAGRRPDSPERRILASLQAGFHGKISAVHPSGGSIAGIAAARRIDELAAVPDLAIVAVPAPDVTSVVDDCGRVGVPAAVVIAAGFAERDPEGARRQEEVLSAARRHGMRVVGPNSLGVVSTRCDLDATFTNQTFRPGGIAIAAQSGGVGIAVAAEAARRHAGITSFVSMGNKIDVSGNDLLRLWADDVDTTVVVLYLESFGDPVRFARVARAVSQRKPIVALKGGRTAPGRRGARWHTASVATDDVAVEALFAHAGVLQAGTLEELIDVALLLDGQPAPTGRRVALVGNVGGPLILGADAAATAGLDVVELSAQLQDEITRLAPTAASTANPVDLGESVTPDHLAAVVQALGSSGEVDACVLVSMPVDARSGDVVDALDARVKLDIPLAIAVVGCPDHGGSLATYPTPERAASAMAVAARRATWLAGLEAEREDSAGHVDDPEALMVARRIVRHRVRLAAAEGGDFVARHRRWLDPATILEMLTAIGVPVAPWRHVRSAAECEQAAEVIGVRCAVKAVAAGLLESDEEARIVGLGDPVAAADAYRTLAKRLGTRFDGAVVQAETSAGRELLVGVVREPAFGPMVVIGDAGAEAELRDDRAVLVAPVTRTAARKAIERLRIAPLFHGYRGRPKLPIDAVSEIVYRAGLLAAAVPEIVELDLNPVMVDAGGCVVVDARVGVSDTAIPPAPMRGLRGHWG